MPEQPTAGRKTGSLIPRLVSGVALAIPTIAAIHYGYPFFDVLVAMLAVLMCWEWARLCTGNFRTDGIVLTLLALGAILFALLGYLDAALITAIVAMPCVYLVARMFGRKSGLWLSAGMPYIAIPVICFLWLRGHPDVGRELIYWLVLVVWATDIGAYAFGKTIGGPKLAPRFSPNKTWAGLLGGALCAAAVSMVIAHGLLEAPYDPSVAIAGMIIAVVAQSGDLFESYAKRRFGVKDSSNIIPGHGGVLDRLDGMLLAGAATALMIMIFGKDLIPWH